MLRYLAAAALDRATAVRPVARARDRLRAARAREVSAPHGGPPLPPSQLRVLVSRYPNGDDFLRSSAATANVIRRALGGVGLELESLGSVLDFGCGCGRTARQWADLQGPELHGCDYNPKLVAWCRENLPFMDVRENAASPPSPYPDDTFDFVYAISVLTHLTEPMAHAWVADWRRILKPGGLLLVTTHGDLFRGTLGRRLGPKYDAGEMVVVAPQMEGMNACVAHHPPAYVAERLLRDFAVMSFTPGSESGFRHDVHLVRR